MAETTQKKITLNNFFEQIVEINKVSQKALKKSDESLSVSEKTKIDLERLIQLLKVDFNKETQNIIREDATEDRELRDSFLQLQSSFNDLSGAIGVIRKDLDSLADAFLQMQKGRRTALKQRDRQISKEEDTLQKEGILGRKSGGKISSTDQDYKRSTEQKENKALNALKGLLGGGLLTGLGGLFAGGNYNSPSPSGQIPTGDLMDIISGGEGDIDSVNRGTPGDTPDGIKSVLGKTSSELTVDEIDKAQKEGKISAAGKYQITPAAMPGFKKYLQEKGVDTAKAKFDEQTQNMYRDYFVTKKRPIVGQYLSGDSNVSKDDAQLEIAAEFASVGVPYDMKKGSYSSYDPTVGGPIPGQDIKKGQSLYYGYAGNRANPNVTAGVVKSLSEQLQQTTEPETEPETNSQTSGPQSSITPQKREGVPDLQRPSASIASVNLPPVSGGTQQVGGGQGRGQASTNSYGVKSTTNNMMFAQVLSGSFADKMNIAV